MQRWALISQHDFIGRFELLSQELNSTYGFPNEFVHIRGEYDNFFLHLEKWKKEFDQIRIGPPYGSILAQDLECSNARTMTLQTCDCLHRLDSHWWPRSMLEEAFLRVLAKSHCEIDIHSKAMVIGSGASARAVVLPLIKVGYSQISFTDMDKGKGREFIQDLKKRIFNVQFDFVKQSDISMLPGSYSLVVNTTPDNLDNSLVDDLSYFNYLRPNGLVVDLTVNSLETKFVKQAMLVKAQTIPGYEIAAEVDAHWLDMCFDIQLDVEKYRESLFALINANH